MRSLYGSVTSPYVRRVRIVAQAIGIKFEWIDVTTDAGRMKLHRVAPLMKFPVAEFGDEVVFDSSVILERLMREHDVAFLTHRPQQHWREQNLLNVINGAIDAGIAAFYLIREGVSAEAQPYVNKQLDRMKRSMEWLGEELEGDSFFDDGAVGMPELSLMVALDWTRFRETYDWSTNAALVTFHEARKDHALFASNGPTGPAPSAR